MGDSWCCLEDIARIDQGPTAPIDPHRRTGVQLLTTANLTLDGDLDFTRQSFVDPAGVTEARLLSPGDILFSWRNGGVRHLGKSALFQEEGSFTFPSFLYRIRTDVNPAYLHQYLKFLKESGRFERAKGQANHTFNKGSLRKLPVYVPEPDAQQGMVDVLEPFDGYRRLQTQGLAMALKYKQAFVDHLFSAGNRPGSGKPLESFASSVWDGAPGAMDCIGLKNVVAETGHLTGASLKSLSMGLRFRAGDVLFNRLRPDTRKYHLAEEDGYCSQEFLVLRPRPEVEPRYLFGLVQTTAFLRACVTRGAYPRTAWRFIASSQWPLPNRSQQRAVCDLLSSVYQKIGHIRQGLDMDPGRSLRARLFPKASYMNK